MARAERNQGIKAPANDMLPEIGRVGSVPFLVLIIVLYFGLSAAYNYLTPMTTPAVLQSRDGGAANPDEPAHFLYVKSLASGHLPVFSKSNSDYEAAQPPAYYGLASLVYALSGTLSPDSRGHLVRWTGSLLGGALILVIFLIGREMFPSREEIAATGALFAALLPMNVSLSSSIGNDTATNLIFALFLLQLIRAVRSKEKTLLRWLSLGLIVAAGLWTKSSTLILIPVVVVVLGYCSVRRLQPAAEALKCGTVCLGAALFASLPWLIRNQLLYGDFFAQRVVFQQLAARNVAPSTLIGALGMPWYLKTFITWTFSSYWGVFDSMNLFLPPQIYAVLALLSIGALIGGVVSVIRMGLSAEDRAIYVGWLSLVVLTLAAYLEYNSHFFQVQGRYLYPSLVPLVLTAAVGSGTYLPKKYGSWIQAGCLVGLVLLNILCLSMISGRYSS